MIGQAEIAWFAAVCAWARGPASGSMQSETIGPACHPTSSKQSPANPSAPMKKPPVFLLLLAAPTLSNGAILSAVPANSDPAPNGTSNGTLKTGDVVTIQQGTTVHVADYLVPTLAHSDFNSGLAVASLSMTDRRHAYAGFGTAIGGAPNAANFPAYLTGLPYVLTMNSNRDNVSPAFMITITTDLPGTAYLFLDTRLGDGVQTDAPNLAAVAGGAADWITNDGWQPVITGLKPADYTGPGDILGNDESLDNSINNYYAIYSRQTTGTTFSVHTFGEGRNMYGLAFASVPEPSAAVLGLLAPLALLRRRR